MTGAETEALLELASEPWELWTESRENHIADMVLRSLCARGLASLERRNSTLHKFTITAAGRAALAEESGASNEG